MRPFHALRTPAGADTALIGSNSSSTGLTEEPPDYLKLPQTETTWKEIVLGLPLMLSAKSWWSEITDLILSIPLESRLESPD